jgi:hypothetical protein
MERFAAHVQNCLIDGRHEQISNRVRVVLDTLGNYAGEQSPEKSVTPFSEESAMLRRVTIPDKGLCNIGHPDSHVAHERLPEPRAVV